MSSSSNESMKTVCAWCSKHLSGDRNSTRISHGICSKCYHRICMDALRNNGYNSDPLLTSDNTTTYDIGGEG